MGDHESISGEDILCEGPGKMHRIHTWGRSEILCEDQWPRGEQTNTANLNNITDAKNVCTQ